MSATWISPSLLLLAAPLTAQNASSPDAFLAAVPEGLTVANDLFARSNRGCFVRRSSIAWSADGRRVAYAALRGDDWLPVVGSEVGEAYVYVSPPILAGDHAFFQVVRLKTKKESRQLSWLWVDGRVIGPEDWMGDLAASSNGKQVAYWTQPGARIGNKETSSGTHYLAVASEGADGRWSVVRGKEWSENALIPPLFSGDGRRVFSCAPGHKGWVVLQLSGKRETELSDPEPLIDAFAISESGAALAFVRTNVLSAGSSRTPSASDGAELYFQGKRVGREHKVVTMPAVDAGGQHVAYVVTVGSHATVAVDEEKKPEGSYGHVRELAFDARGTQLAFVANLGGTPTDQTPGDVEGGEDFVVVRSVAGHTPLAEHARYREVRDLVWDARGERLAYCARDESGWHVVCGEAKSAAHDDVGSPRFAGDGTSLGFGTRDGRELWWRVLDLR